MYLVVVTNLYSINLLVKFDRTWSCLHPATWDSSLSPVFLCPACTLHKKVALTQAHAVVSHVPPAKDECGRYTALPSCIGHDEEVVLQIVLNIVCVLALLQPPSCLWLGCQALLVTLAGKPPGDTFLRGQAFL